MSFSPLVKYPEKAAVFAPQYCGSIFYYTAMAAFGKVAIDVDLKYNKRFKSVHRCEIADVNGPLRLTVPVSRPDILIEDRKITWHDFTVSPQANWWSDHLISLESAYGRTPFFEYYIDRFKSWIGNPGMNIVDLDMGIHREIIKILDVREPVPFAEVREGKFYDFRQNQFPAVEPVPYYQVRAQRLGFLPGLSVLDLIFNMGPEAPLVLKEYIRQLNF